MDILDLKRCTAQYMPFLSIKAKAQRLAYSREHKSDTLNNWKATIFTDEASVRLDGHCRTWVTRKTGEAYREECMVPRLHCGRASCMVWGAIYYGGRSELVCFDTSGSKGKKGGVTAVIYRDKITKGELNWVWN
jgi:hypothetical protein